jgi:molybdopterin molybdotransferase
MTLSAISTMTPDDALAVLLRGVRCVECESIALTHATGRVLAQSVMTDRPSPAMDVSAMDGFALRIADVSRDALAISDEISAGEPAQPLRSDSCARIATGAPIPHGAELVVPREHVDEAGDNITVHAIRASAARMGAHIRRRGENAAEGACVLERGVAIHAPAAAALAAFGVVNPRVTRKVRIALLVTGDEVRTNDDALAPWCVRDSNGPSVTALFARHAWAAPIVPEHVVDSAAALRDALTRAIELHDLVLVTGGVAVGHRDFVATVLDELGALTHFHGVAQRPGRPLLAATLRDRRILCLPGNPVSVMTTARRYALPLARVVGGFSAAEPMSHSVALVEALRDCVPLTRFVPVHISTHGNARALITRGSADSAAVASSDGFVEIPASESGVGPWRFFEWS